MSERKCVPIRSCLEFPSWWTMMLSVSQANPFLYMLFLITVCYHSNGNLTTPELVSEERHHCGRLVYGFREDYRNVWNLRFTFKNMTLLGTPTWALLLVPLTQLYLPFALSEDMHFFKKRNPAPVHAFPRVICDFTLVSHCSHLCLTYSSPTEEIISQLARPSPGISKHKVLLPHLQEREPAVSSVKMRA